MNNGPNAATESSSNLLGPFWRSGSPRTENGGSLLRSSTPGPALFFKGSVRRSRRKADCRSRGRRLARLSCGWPLRESGSRTGGNEFARKIYDRCQRRVQVSEALKPAGYPIPDHGPVGALLNAQKRHNFLVRAHLHFPDLQAGFQDPRHVADLFARRPASRYRFAIRRDARARRPLRNSRKRAVLASPGSDGRMVFAGTYVHSSGRKKLASHAASFKKSYRAHSQSFLESIGESMALAPPSKLSKSRKRTPAQVKREGSFELEIAADKALPFFTLGKGACWLSGWDPEPIYPAQSGCSFQSNSVFRLDPRWRTFAADHPCNRFVRNPPGTPRVA